MNLGRSLLAGTVLALCTTPAAWAAPKVMATAPAASIYPMSQSLYCDILNLHADPKNVTVEVMNYDGMVVTGPIGPFQLLPNQGFPVFDASGIGAWCRFTVEGSTKKYRAAAVYDNGSSYTVIVPAY